MAFCLPIGPDPLRCPFLPVTHVRPCVGDLGAGHQAVYVLVMLIGASACAEASAAGVEGDHEVTEEEKEERRGMYAVSTPVLRDIDLRCALGTRICECRAHTADLREPYTICRAEYGVGLVGITKAHEKEVYAYADDTTVMTPSDQSDADMPPGQITVLDARSATNIQNAHQRQPNPIQTIHADAEPRPRINTTAC